MTIEPPERLNIADHFLDARVREGRGSRPALRTDAGTLSYSDVQALANRFGNALTEAGIEPEHRVLLALPDGPEFVAALFGTLKVGAVVVMVNPALPPGEIGYFLEYTRARVIVTHKDTAAAFQAAARGSRFAKAVLVVGDEAFDRSVARASASLEVFPSHRDDPAIWLFSGGTTGRPKAVIQTHRSFANTGGVLRQGRDRLQGERRDPLRAQALLRVRDRVEPLLSVRGGSRRGPLPRGANRRDPLRRIAQFRPTILINVPTMIHKMVSHPDAGAQDFSSIRLSTSAGEALPVELHERWRETFGVDLLDGLGTAEMWHIFISNRPGRARPGTLGTVVPGFEVKVCDEEGKELGRGETGWLWVRGDSRAIAYWQQMEKTAQGFRGEWYVSGDLITMDGEGYVTYCGRGDEMLKVSGKWLAPQEVEGCLLQHPGVVEAAVVGATDSSGLVKPRAYVVPRARRDGLDEELKAFVRERLEPYKHPREVVFVDSLPRTHLGKVDRGRLRIS